MAFTTFNSYISRDTLMSNLRSLQDARTKLKNMKEACGHERGLQDVCRNVATTLIEQLKKNPSLTSNQKLEVTAFQYSTDNLSSVDSTLKGLLRQISSLANKVETTGARGNQGLIVPTAERDQYTNEVNELRREVGNLANNVKAAIKDGVALRTSIDKDREALKRKYGER